MRVAADSADGRAISNQLPGPRECRLRGAHDESRSDVLAVRVRNWCGRIVCRISAFPGAGSLAVEHFGARRTIFWIMASWGVISASCALIRGPASFYALRFLLGLAEAGFVPGMLFYLTLWFPNEYRVRYAAGFSSAIAYAGIIV